MPSAGDMLAEHSAEEFSTDTSTGSVPSGLVGDNCLGTGSFISVAGATVFLLTGLHPQVFWPQDVLEEFALNFRAIVKIKL